MGSRNKNYRKFGVDLAFSNWHRHHFEEHYERRWHVMCTADRDWTEYCYYCSEPVAILEEKLDFGQNLVDKDYGVTRRLAERSRLQAYMISPKIERPPHVQQEIDELQARVIELQTKYPIPYFSAMELWPHKTDLKRYTESEFALFIGSLHRHHHINCAKAAGDVDEEKLYRIRRELGLPVPAIQDNLFDFDGRD